MKMKSQAKYLLSNSTFSLWSILVWDVLNLKSCQTKQQSTWCIYSLKIGCIGILIQQKLHLTMGQNSLLLNFRINNSKESANKWGYWMHPWYNRQSIVMHYIQRIQFLEDIVFDQDAWLQKRTHELKKLFMQKSPMISGEYKPKLCQKGDTVSVNWSISTKDDDTR